MSLYQKYRPENMSEVFGNQSIKESLETLLAKKEKPHAFLFTGPSGAGKTTFARIIKTMLGCSDKDYMELNAATTRGIDTVREVANNARFAAMNGSVKVYLFDEVHGVTGAAAEAMLKMLEDPPKHCYFILCTTNPEKLLKTIKTRCTIYQVESLKKRDIISLCKWVLENEGADAPIAVLTEIAKQCDGSPRKALVMLESIIGMANEESQLSTLQAGITDEATVKELIDAILAGAKWPEVSKIIKGITEEPESVRRQILGYINGVALNAKDTPVQSGLLLEAFSKPYYDTGKAGLTMSCIVALLG